MPKNPAIFRTPGNNYFEVATKKEIVQEQSEASVMRL